MRGSAAFRAAVAPGGVLAGPWVRNDLWRRARAVPSLDLRFADTKSLTDAVTGQSLIAFTRASSTTYVGSDGLIKTAATNEARFDHNPTTGESLGLLVEEQRTNLLPSSVYTANSNGWTNGVIGGAGSIASASVTNKTGNTNGVFNISGLDGNGYIGCFISTTSSANTYTASVFVKNNGGTVFQLRVVHQSGGTYKASGTQYTFSTGAWQDGIAGTTAPAARSVQDMGDGWFRFSISSVDNNSGNTQTAFLFYGGTTTTNYNYYLWGAQLEAGAFPTSYIPTTTAAVTRSADVASITGTAFSSWFNAGQGSVYAESRVQPFTVTTFPRIASLDRGDGTSNFIAQVRSNGLSRMEFSAYATTGQAVGLQPNVTFLADSTAKTCFSYAADDFINSANGILSVADTSGTVPTSLTVIGIGMQGNATLQYNGTIRRLTYWPQRLSNPTLQAITQ